MTNAALANPAPAAAPVAGMGIPFTVASRPQRRFSNTQTVNNLAAGGSFQVVQLPATGWVRKVTLFFEQTITFASAGAVVAGDAPFNLISSITLTDATGQPILQPISGYQLYLVNKFFNSGGQGTNEPRPWENPHMGPEFNHAATGTSGTAAWRLDIDFEIDARTGYGCIPNLDSNASLQLRVDYAASTVAYTGTTGSASNLTMRVSQEYWAPVGSSIGGAPVDSAPPGAGDYQETRYETQTVSASAENLVTLTNRGGLVRGLILISRAAGVRTALTADANLGLLLDNQPINEGIPIEEHYDQSRRMYGYVGADLTTSYAPLSAGIASGLDRGVVPVNFAGLSLGRNSWLTTRAGSLFQAKITPGASATTLEVVTVMCQAKDAAAFYNAG
jgi:hypothetical protein